jgi:hypothetical protein
VEAPTKHEYQYDDFDENTADAVSFVENVEAFEWWQSAAVAAGSFVLDFEILAATSRQSAADREEGVCRSVQKVWEVRPQGSTVQDSLAR